MLCSAYAYVILFLILSLSLGRLEELGLPTFVILSRKKGLSWLL